MSRSTPTKKNILLYLEVHPESGTAEIARGIGRSESATASALQFLQIEGEVHVSREEPTSAGRVSKRYSLGSGGGLTLDTRNRPSVMAQRGHLMTERVKKEARALAGNPFGVLIAQLAKSEVTG